MGSSSGKRDARPVPSGYGRTRSGSLMWRRPTLDQLRQETASAAKDFVENGWIGRTVAIGEAVRLNVTDPCPRCVMTTLPQGDLAKDLGILRAAADHNRVHVPFAGADMPSVVV